MANVVSDAEMKMIEEAKAMRKAIAEREVKAKAYIQKKQKVKSNYNTIVSILLITGVVWLLFVEGKL